MFYTLLFVVWAFRCWFSFDPLWLLQTRRCITAVMSPMFDRRPCLLNDCDVLVGWLVGWWRRRVCIATAPHRSNRDRALIEFRVARISILLVFPGPIHMAKRPIWLSLALALANHRVDRLYKLLIPNYAWQMWICSLVRCFRAIIIIGGALFVAMCK